MKVGYSRADVLRTVKNMVLVIGGTLILAFGTAVFILPFNLVVGGISGIALIVKNILPFEFISIDLIVTVVTWLLFFIGFAVLGKSFALKTLVSTIIYPIAISAFIRLASPDVLGGLFYLQASEHSEISLILAATVGGVLIGAGCAVTFLGGGSTGGVDIISLVLCKFFKKWKSSVVIFLVDATIVTAGIFVIGDLVLCLLGIISAMLAAFMIDKVFLGGSKAFIAHIVTDKYSEINDVIIHKINRTTTIFDAVGGYSGEGKKMLMVSFTMSQYAELMAVINKIDKDAFMTIHRAHEINGEGWTR